jgi:hypothetical protein
LDLFDLCRGRVLSRGIDHSDLILGMERLNLYLDVCQSFSENCRRMEMRHPFNCPPRGTMKFCAIAFLAFPFAVFAQQSDDVGKSTKQPAHVIVEVKSQLYGSFSQERDVNLGETGVFSNLGSNHKAVRSDGPCQITADAKNPPRDIDDGVVVKITPELHTSTRIVGFEDEVIANKFIKYNVLNEGKCGKISMANSVSDSTASTMMYHTGKPLVLTSMRQDIEGDQRDLDVTVIFTPVAAH